MGFGVSVLFYLIVGTGVAIATWIGETPGGDGFRFRVLTSPLFWPIYLPVLLARRTVIGTGEPMSIARRSRAADEMSSLIAKVESELEAAFRSLDGWAEKALADQREPIHELRIAWRQQADAIRELDVLLAGTKIDLETSIEPESSAAPSTASAESTVAATEVPAADPAHGDDDARSRAAMSERTRARNLIELEAVRRRMYDDLMATLAWVRQLVTMIHLAKYTGAPASRAEELVRQIAAAVEGLSTIQRTHHA